MEFLRLELFKNDDVLNYDQLEQVHTPSCYCSIFICSDCLRARAHYIFFCPQMCINAEPNYGHLWLYCKNSPLESSKETFATAYNVLKQQRQRSRAASVGASTNIETAAAAAVPATRNGDMLSLYWHCNVSQLSDNQRWMQIFGGENPAN